MLINVLSAAVTAEDDLDFSGKKEMYMLNKSAIIRACVCPCDEVGSEVMSMLESCLGLVGWGDLSRLAVMFLYSTFLVVEQVIQLLQTLVITCLALG